jgi:hypothetical protein
LVAEDQAVAGGGRRDAKRVQGGDDPRMATWGCSSRAGRATRGRSRQANGVLHQL